MNSVLIRLLMLLSLGLAVAACDNGDHHEGDHGHDHGEAAHAEGDDHHGDDAGQPHGENGDHGHAHDEPQTEAFYGEEAPSQESTDDATGTGESSDDTDTTTEDDMNTDHDHGDGADDHHH